MIHLIEAKRLNYGKYRYMLIVERRVWVFSIRNIYQIAGEPDAEWHDINGDNVGGFLADDLDHLLSRALVCNQVPPQSIPSAVQFTR